MYNSPDWWFSSPLIVGWGVFVVLIVLWSLYWQARAMWKAAQARELGWFIALLLIHTAGILDILYIYVFSKTKQGPTNHASSMPPHHHDQTPMVTPSNQS